MNSHELWQVEVDGRVYEACMDEVIEWIHEGAVLPSDRIRRGSLRWIAAQRVPELDDHFRRSAFLNDPDIGVTAQEASEFQTADHSAHEGKAKSSIKGFCAKHRSIRAAYVCATCGESYCSDCCNRFGNVKLCPECGAMCLPYTRIEELDQIHGALNRPYARKIGAASDVSGPASKITFTEILTSIRKPFARPLRFIVQTSSIAALSIVSGVAIVSEFKYLLLSVIAVFGVSAIAAFITDIAFEEFRPVSKRTRAISRYLRALRNGTLSLAVGFGPFVLLIAAAMVFAWFQFAGSVDIAEDQMINTQNHVTKFVSEKDPSSQNKPRFNTAVEARRENLANSFFGVGSESSPIGNMLQLLFRLSVFFLLPVGGAFLIGALLFPAICVNSIESEKTLDRISPIRSLKLIRTAGYEYMKLLTVGILFLTSTITTFVLVEQAAQLSGSLMGAIAAGLAAAGALFAYFWAIFSRLIGLTFLEEPPTSSAAIEDFHEITQIQ